MNEVLDPVHGFITFDDFEKTIIDSPPVQRLRDIHQLALEFMVYPGATHKRFEHSLGVMHLAGRVFNSLFDKDHLTTAVKSRLKEEMRGRDIKYWKRVVRLAGLLHDIGHGPFSHSTEAFLPPGKTHEHMTESLLKWPPLRERLKSGKLGVEPADVVDCAIDFKKRPAVTLSPWKTLLNEIITSDVFGADRMDYLQRDATYTGTAYGKFDLERLIDCLRIIRDDVDNLGVGLDRGGLRAAESLLVARYFMYEQVYYHDIRLIYDEHLADFLKAELGARGLPGVASRFLKYSDSRFLLALRRAALDKQNAKHEQARRIIDRQHFKRVYALPVCDRNAHPGEYDDNVRRFQDILDAMEDELGEKNVKNARRGPNVNALQETSKTDKKGENGDERKLWVVEGEGMMTEAGRISVLIRNIPPPDVAYVYCPASPKDLPKRAYGIIKKFESPVSN